MNLQLQPRKLWACAAAMMLLAAPAARAQVTDESTIVDIAVETPAFSTLVTALQAAGLVETLQGDGPFTVFAPTDDAFAALPTGLLDELLADPDRLRHILLYHVNHGPRLRSTDLTTGKVSTMQGAPIRIEVTDTGVSANQASVISADTEALNGVIHIIDEVILPVGGLAEREVSATVKNGMLTVVWPDSATETLSVEYAINPNGPWIPLMQPVTNADGISKIEMEATGAGMFFRLNVSDQ